MTNGRAAFAGRCAVVTGAAHGIGEAIARRLIDAGANVIVLDRDADRLARGFEGVACTQVVAEVGAVDPQALANRLLSDHGPIEIIVNNVSAWTGRRVLQEQNDESLVSAFRTNLHDPMFLTKRLVETLIKLRLRGCVLFVSSLHDHYVRLYPSYSVAKAGIAMLIKEMAYEFAPYGVRVNGISPGWIETANPGEATIAEQCAVGLIPMGRFGEPDDLGRMALTLLDDDWSSYVTGTNVVVDGGLSLHNWLMDV